MSQQPLFVYIPEAQAHVLRETAQAGTQAVISSSQSNLILPDLLDEIHRSFVATLSEASIRRMNGRIERGLEMAKSSKVGVTDNPDVFIVQSSKAGRYTVNLAERTCTCPDSQAGNVCKHRVAAYYIQRALFQVQAQTKEASSLEALYALEDRPEDEDEIEAVIVAVSESRLFPKERITWAVAKTLALVDIPVEVLSVEDKVAHVRALPVMLDGELVPIFPFPSPFDGVESLYSTADIPLSELSHFRFYGG